MKRFVRHAVFFLFFIVATATCDTYIKLQACGVGDDSSDAAAMSQGPPGKAGPPGTPGPAGVQGAKGSKGDSGVLSESLRANLTALTSQHQATANATFETIFGKLQAAIEKIDAKLAGVASALETTQLQVANLTSVRSALETTQLQVANLTREANPSFTIVRTPAKQNWWQSKIACRELGGELLNQAMLINNQPGRHYYNEILELASGDTLPWIDLSDSYREGSWLTGTGAGLGESLFSMKRGEPNGGRNSNCAHLYPDGELNDTCCTISKYALCEISSA